MSVVFQNSEYRPFSTLTALFDYIESTFIRAFANLECQNFVKVEGTIKLGDRRKKYYFGRLYNEKESVSLWIPIELGDSLSETLQIDLNGSVYGEVRIRNEFGSLKPYILVHDIEIRKLSEREILTKNLEEDLLLIWKEHGTRYDRVFPQEPYISVVRPFTDTAYQDFKTKLRESEFNLQIEDIPTDITSPDSLIEAIKRAGGNVLVLLRGGGSEEVFSVFDDLRVVKVWASQQAFKIFAVGHTEHKGYLLEMFSDAVKRTPTEAAEYLISELEKTRLFADCSILKGKFLVLEKNRKEIIKERDNLRQQLSELEKEKTKLEADVRRLKSLEKESKELRDRIQKLEILKMQIAEKEKILREKDERLLALQKEIEKLKYELEAQNKRIVEINKDLNQKSELLEREQTEKSKMIKQLQRNKRISYIFLLMGLLIGLLVGLFVNIAVH